ncbi:hypothetical protein ACFL35_16325, partial [Candidatus Riflebacteria bacterium]
LTLFSDLHLILNGDTRNHFRWLQNYNKNWRLYSEKEIVPSHKAYHGNKGLLVNEFSMSKLTGSEKEFILLGYCDVNYHFGLLLSLLSLFLFILKFPPSFKGNYSVLPG